MSHRRSVIIVVAVALAAVAFVGNLLYLKGAEDRAYGNAKLVDAFVVKTAIPKGTTGEQAIAEKMVAAGRIPQQYRPGTAITTLDDLRAKVALTALVPGQVVVAGQFVSPNVAQTTFAQRIPAGQVAISITVDQMHAVAGFIVPGDKVNILVYGKEPNSREQKSGMRVLYQNVNVLAVGSTPALQPGETAAKPDAKAPASTVSSSLITLAVPLDAAERILVPAAGANGAVIFLALVPPNSVPTDPAPPIVDESNVYNNLPVTPYK